jgi:N-acetylmuramoyl-L-alanine amidase
MKKIALIVGHYVNGKDKGAVSYTGEPESKYNLRIASKLSFELSKLGIEAKIYTRDEYVTFARIAESIKAFNAQISIELHFNSFAQAALGCECLALVGDNDSISFADLLTDKIADIMHVSERHDEFKKNDGVLLIAKGGRGYNNLNIIKSANKIPTVLIEPCFANIKTKESAKFFETEQLYVDSLSAAIVSWLNSTAVKSVNTKGLPVSPKNTVERIMNSVKKSDY